MGDIDGIAFGAGPGSFTGVRIACGVAQGLAFGLDRPVIPVTTLEAIAQEAWRLHGALAVLAAIDARMGEVYTAAFLREHDAWREVAAPAVLAPSAVAVPDDRHGWVAAGNAFAAIAELASSSQFAPKYADVRATGRAIGELAAPRFSRGEGVAADAALPVYVRHRVALTTAERDAGLRL
jgi:tRNA threonylcarbamoyladenosine biosynthesis protein TsaB